MRPRQDQHDRLLDGGHRAYDGGAALCQPLSKIGRDDVFVIDDQHVFS